MALKLAGEQCAVVQGLDSEGYVETVRTLLPDNDDARYLGSATLGWKGIYLGGDKLLKESGTYVVIRNAADTAGRDLDVSRLYGQTLEFVGNIDGGGAAPGFRTYPSTTARVIFQGYGSGAYVEHARLAPNNFELNNGKLTGNFDCNGQLLKDPKNYADATLSGTPILLAIDIGGAEYYAKFYPTKT